MSPPTLPSRSVQVIEPKKAFYQEPIATLDFASLYPSIMQAYNLCYSTLVSREERAKLKPEDYIVTPSNECFVKPSVRKGILPLILDELLAARKRAKKDMAAATDPMVRACVPAFVGHHACRF